MSNPFGAAFKRATDEEKLRLFGCSTGEPGSRKTSFWLEGPGPIAVFSMDQGLEGVVGREIRNTGKEIYVREYDWQPTKDGDYIELKTAAELVRDQYMADFEMALKVARTILVDKETDVWGLFRYAEFGPEGNDAPRNYPALNQRYRRLVNMAKATDVNVGFIDGMKDEWGTKVKSNGAQGAASTGRRIRSGFGELEGLVHFDLHHTGLQPDIDKDNAWNIHVGKARGPEGWRYAGTDIGSVTFQEFAMLIYPGSSPEDWE